MDEFNDLIKFVGFKCPCCGVQFSTTNISVDHILPLSMGGSNYIDNIQPLCVDCNVRKNAKEINYLTNLTNVTAKSVCQM